MRGEETCGGAAAFVGGFSVLMGDGGGEAVVAEDAVGEGVAGAAAGAGFRGSRGFGHGVRAPAGERRRGWDSTMGRSHPHWP